mmetsp:Transcript_9725/g.14350  ORF Transcript_9725/g.14350 Transcript_9725/m.14350 type:complete len:230 (-) Transcript_9725:24-713(-)
MELVCISGIWIIPSVDRVGISFCCCCDCCCFFIGFEGSKSCCEGFSSIILSSSSPSESSSNMSFDVNCESVVKLCDNSWLSIFIGALCLKNAFVFLISISAFCSVCSLLSPVKILFIASSIVLLDSILMSSTMHELSKLDPVIPCDCISSDLVSSSSSSSSLSSSSIISMISCDSVVLLFVSNCSFSSSSELSSSSSSNIINLSFIPFFLLNISFSIYSSIFSECSFIN